MPLSAEGSSESECGCSGLAERVLALDLGDLRIVLVGAVVGVACDVHEQMARPCNTGRMPAFSIFTSNEFSDAEVLSLYESVGWAAYTRFPELLTRAIRSSSFVVTARNANGELVGLARVVSDDATICYLQDILVRPPFQGAGVGRALVEQVTARYAHVRQTVLITDNEPGQRAFYEAMGFMEGSNFAPEPVRVFALFR